MRMSEQYSTEQYIYSRSEREFTNVLNQTIPIGFGFMSFSPGMDKTLKQDVAVYCEDCPRIFQTDGQGVPLPLFRKVRLPKGRVLLQGSTWIEKGTRDFHVAHGYVLEDKLVKDAGPAVWLRPKFRVDDPNNAHSGILPWKTLKTVSEIPKEDFLVGVKRLKDAALELDIERYCQLLLACFDALASRRQVLIAWDFKQNKEPQLWRSVLYWIYTFLPYDLWISLGFDSVYTDKSSPGLTHLAFVDEASIRTEGQTYSIQLGNQMLSLGGNFLALGGKIEHNDSKYSTDWYGKNSDYARRLERIVDIVWNGPREADKMQALAQELKAVLRSLYAQMDSMPEGKRLNQEESSRTCDWEEGLQKLKEIAGLEKPKFPNTKPEFPVANRTIPSAEKSEPDPSEVYQNIFQQRMQTPGQGNRDKDLKALASIRGEKEPDAIGLLSAFMAREADAQGTELMEVLCRYEELLKESDAFVQLPRRLFWDELTEKEKNIWSDCGVKSGDDAARQRRVKWYKEIVSAYKPEECDKASYFERCLDMLRGISRKFRDNMEEELWMTSRTMAKNRENSVNGDSGI